MSAPPAHSFMACCINPDCRQSYSQISASQTVCETCGTELKLNQRFVALKCLESGTWVKTYGVFDLKTRTEQLLRVLVDNSMHNREQFRHEAIALAQLSHPGLPKVIACFRVDISHPQRNSLHCMVMERIRGTVLQDVLKFYPQGCPELWIVDWLKQAVESMDRLHQQGIIHGDLKPGVLVLREENQQLAIASLGDAGRSAQLLAENEATGPLSEGYSPPEKLMGRVLHPSSDVYALGKTFIHLLTGQHPFAMEQGMGQRDWHDKVQAHPQLLELLNQMVHHRPDQRPMATEILNGLVVVAKQLAQQSVKGMKANSSVVKPVSGLAKPAAPFHAQPGLSASNAARSTKPVAKSASSSEPRSATHQARSSRPRLRTDNTRSMHPASLPYTDQPAAELVAWDYARPRTSKIQTLAFNHGLRREEIQEWLVQSSVATFQSMFWAGLGGALATALGMWLVGWSPLKPWLDGVLSAPSTMRQLPIAIYPGLLVFALAGAGIVWGFTQTQNAEFDRILWRRRLWGAIAFCVGWLSWPLLSLGVDFTQVLARLTAVLAVGLVFSLGMRNRFLNAGVTAFGTSQTILLLLGANVLNAVALQDLFQPRVPADPSAWGAAVLFFALLGVVFGGWLGISHYLVQPCLNWVSRQLS